MGIFTLYTIVGYMSIGKRVFFKNIFSQNFKNLYNYLKSVYILWYNIFSFSKAIIIAGG